MLVHKVGYAKHSHHNNLISPIIMERPAFHTSNTVNLITVLEGLCNVLELSPHTANDVLLSHMITFLNDKHDRHLRMSFFTSIVGVAAYIGCHCADILKPLLLQVLI